MALHGRSTHYRLKDIRRRHFNATAARCGVGDTAEPLIEEALAATPNVIASVQRDIPDGFPAHVLDTVLRGLADSARRLGE